MTDNNHMLYYYLVIAEYQPTKLMVKSKLVLGVNKLKCLHTLFGTSFQLNKISLYLHIIDEI